MGRELDEDLSLVVGRLGALVERLERSRSESSDDLPLMFKSDVPVSMLETLYEARRLRDATFGKDADLFGEPSWDILLDAAIMAAKGKRVSVTSACLASAAPSTTALRYISALEERGYLQSEADPLDGRRRFLHLTQKGKRVLREYTDLLLNSRDAVSRV